MRLLMVFSMLFLMGCEDSVQPIPVEPHEKQAFEKNATDAVGVAEGDKQVSPFGKPAY
ncbi:MAG: hypothetical protein ACE5DZ_01995 [Mariprofundus sp.]